MKNKIQQPAARRGGEEALVLAGLMHTHRDACAFYKVAADRTGDAAFTALKALHEEALGALWARLQALGPLDFLEGADTDVREFFGPLARHLGANRSRSALGARLRAAEKSAAAAAEEVLGGLPSLRGVRDGQRAVQARIEALLAAEFGDSFRT